jgi:peptidoglycan/xylan/chitin deacetylase (PgdA/CDA1 family)
MQWKNDARCAVTISFDIDGKERWLARARGGNEAFASPLLAHYGEYGPKVAMPHILDLFEKYDMPAGFFIPGLVAQEHPEMTQKIHEAGHEIGFHGHTHAGLAGLSDEQEAEEYARALDTFDDLIGETPVGHRQWSSERTLNRMIELGFEYSSLSSANDVPYLLEADAGDIIEVPVQSAITDTPYFTFQLGPVLGHQSGVDAPSKAYEIWSSEFDACVKRGCLFHLVLHPQMIGRPHRLDMVEKLIQYITGHSDVWIAQPREIAQYWRDEHADNSMRLDLSLDTDPILSAQE